MMLQQSTWGVSQCLAEPAHSFSAVKESLHFIAAAQVVWGGAVTLLGLMQRRGQQTGDSGREKGVSHFHCLAWPTQEPLLFQHMAQSRALSCCWWQGLSCTSTRRALGGVYWGGIVLGSSSPSPELAAQQVTCCPLPTAPVGSCLFCWCLEIAPCLVSSQPLQLTGSSVLQQPHTSFTWLMTGCFLKQTDGMVRGSSGKQDSDTLHRRGSLRLKKQKQCCFHIKEVNVTYHIHNFSWLFPPAIGLSPLTYVPLDTELLCC